MTLIVVFLVTTFVLLLAMGIQRFVVTLDRQRRRNPVLPTTPADPTDNDPNAPHPQA